jgi:hypothetical protein
MMTRASARAKSGNAPDSGRPDRAARPCGACRPGGGAAETGGERAWLRGAAVATGLLLLADPVSGQDACPWGGAVAKVQRLPQEITFGTFAELDVFGRVQEIPDCVITVAAVRDAAKHPACGIYAGRPDALGMEMVFSCLLEKTNGDPPAGTHVDISALAAQRLLSGQ